MSARSQTGATWPTPEQELLLQAALWSDMRAIDAWAEWKSRVTSDRLDVGSQRLLPLVYRNLSALRVGDSLIGLLKLQYHRTWYENQPAFHHLAAVLRSFHDAGIKTLVLKGGALVLLHYRDHGLRPMSDFDVLVPTCDALRAIDVIASSGWTPKTKLPLPEMLTSVAHGMGFKSADASRPRPGHSQQPPNPSRHGGARDVQSEIARESVLLRSCPSQAFKNHPRDWSLKFVG